jgi:hypothetical protein
LELGALKAMLKEPSPGVATRFVGAPGGVASGMLADVAETIPSPALVTAKIWYLGEVNPLKF